MIYYGDEAGMWGADDPSSRQPMVWSDLEPYDNTNVRFNKDIFSHYRKIIAIYNTYTALKYGSFKTVFIGDESGIYAYKRVFDDETVLIILNNSSRQQTVNIPDIGKTCELFDIYDIYNEKNYNLSEGKIEVEKKLKFIPESDIISVNMQPLDACIFVISKRGGGM